LHERLAARLGRRAASALSTTAAVILVLIPGILLVALLLAEAPAALRAVTQSRGLQELAAFRVAGIDIGAYADTVVNSVVSWVSGRAVIVIGSVTMATVNLVIAIFGLYYLLISDGATWRQARRLLPFSPETVDLLADRFRTTTESMIIGIVLTAVAQGTVVGLAFALVGLPSAAFWGFMTACVSILPILGSALVWLPGTAVLAADHRYGAAVGLFVTGLIVASQIDNVILLFVYRRVSRIHPMVTLVGAFAGIRLFGLVGLLLGPLAISYLMELLTAYSSEPRRLVDSRRAARSIAGPAAS
jgi:predicted PurR-regulated permease PerM